MAVLCDESECGAPGKSSLGQGIEHCFDVETPGSSNRQALDDVRIDWLASELREICRTATLDLSYRIGELIIREVYGGRIDFWRTQGTRRPCYRRLSTRGDLPLSPSALCKSVAVYVLSERLGGKAAWRHLGASHVQEVLSLPPGDQDRVLEAAEQEGWTVARIRSEVRALRPSPRGRRRVESFRKSVEALRACIVKHQSSLIDVGALEHLDERAADQFRDALTTLKLHVNRLEHALGRCTQRVEEDQARTRDSFLRLASCVDGAPADDSSARAREAG